MSSIKYEDISFVVQGPIHPIVTKKCLLSIRRFFPGSKIIVSTWEGSDISELEYDLLVFSRDPGAVSYCIGDKIYFNNINRQIVSVINGLKIVNTKYVAKVRSDAEFINDNFLDHYNKYDIYNENYKFFKDRIIAPTYFFRNPRHITLLFHISDIFHFGNLDDILNLWDISLAPEPETTRWFDRKFEFFNTLPSISCRYAPEQYIWISFLRKKGLRIRFEYSNHLSIDNVLLSEQTIVNNFVIETPQNLGLNLPQRFEDGDIYSIYQVSDWEFLYKKLCIERAGNLIHWWLILPAIVLKLKNFIRILRKKEYWQKMHTKKHV
jgi:hypothetical protein